MPKPSPAKKPLVTKPARKTSLTTRATRSTAKAGKSSPAPNAPSRDTKQSRLIALLQTKSGATMTQIVKITGWQAHTVRGTISGVLRKKLGFEVSSTPNTDSGDRLYRITGKSVAA